MTTDLVITLEEALKDRSQEGKFYLYKIEVGGESYIGFTSQSPKNRLEQHLQSAKSGSPYLIHKKLREFGFYYDFEIIGEYSHEVEALLNEIIYIKKYNAKLNISNGGEGKKYKVIRGENNLGENVYKVLLVDEYTKLIKEKEALKKQEEIESRKSNGTVFFDFIQKLAKDNPLDFEIGSNKRGVLFCESRKLNSRNILLAEVFKKYSQSGVINIPDIYFYNVCHYQWLEDKKGQCWGFDRDDFKNQLDVVYDEIVNPKLDILKNIKEKMYYEQHNLYRCVDKNPYNRSFNLEMNAFDETMSKEFTKTYEKKLFNEAKYFLKEINDLSSTCFHIPFKGYRTPSIPNASRGEFPELTKEEFLNASREKFNTVKKYLLNLENGVKTFYCFGTYKVPKKGLFSIGTELKVFYTSFDLK